MYPQRTTCPESRYSSRESQELKCSASLRAKLRHHGGLNIFFSRALLDIKTAWGWSITISPSHTVARISNIDSEKLWFEKIVPVADRRTVFDYSYFKLSLTSCWTASSSFRNDSLLYLVAVYCVLHLTSVVQAQFTHFYAPHFPVKSSLRRAQTADFGVLKSPNRTHGLRLTLFDHCHA